MRTNPLLRAIKTGISSLMLHKLRSLLTTMGVLFGTSSVIAMLAIGEGASHEAQEQIKLLGSQNVILRTLKPKQEANTGNQGRVAIYGLTNEDFDSIKSTFPGISSAVPVREIAAEVRVGTKVLVPRVMATVPSYQLATGRKIWDGRFLSEEDDRTRNSVCVLGTEVARALFPFESPLGLDVKIGADYYRVVGTLAPRVLISQATRQSSGGVTGEVFIPFGTASARYGGLQVKNTSGSREMEEVDLHEVVIAVDEGRHVSVVAQASRALLARSHKDQNDYEVVVPLELLASAEETKRIFNIVLGSIAGISLLVGGIGIMNVMLATVTERTREIGIRRALGAKRRHIVVQFLVETICLSVGGGALGVALGLVIPLVVSSYAEIVTIVKPSAPILAFLISAGIGVVFGIYPAWRAASMDPVEALRHE